MSLTEMERVALEQRKREQEEQQEETPVDFAEEGDTEIEVPTGVDFSGVGGNEEPKPAVDYDKLAGPLPQEVEDIDFEEEQENTEVKIEEAVTTLAENKNCPRCGFDLEDKPKEPTEADKQEYIKSILGERAFVKRYYHFDDTLTVKLHSLSIGEERAIKTLIEDAIEKKELRTVEDWEAKRMELRTSFMLKKLTLRTKEVEFMGIPVDVDKEATLEALNKVTNKRSKLPAAVAGVLSTSVNDFDELYITLTSRSEDPDFWRGLDDSKL